MTVGTFDSIIEADLVREELESAGIQAWVSSATVAQTFVSMPETGLGIQVAAQNAERAHAIVAQALNSRASITDAELEAAAMSAPNSDIDADDVDTGRAPTQYDDAESGG